MHAMIQSGPDALSVPAPPDQTLQKAVDAAGHVLRDADNIDDLASKAARAAEGAGASAMQAATIGLTLESAARAANTPGEALTASTIVATLKAAASVEGGAAASAEAAASVQPNAEQKAATFSGIDLLRVLAKNGGRVNIDQLPEMLVVDRSALEGPWQEMYNDGFIEQKGDDAVLTDAGTRFIDFARFSRL
jgi:hypothetical protein